VANASITGRTSQDVLYRQIEIYRNVRPDFATILIGVNDQVQGVGLDIFSGYKKIILSILVGLYCMLKI